MIFYEEANTIYGDGTPTAKPLTEDEMAHRRDTYENLVAEYSVKVKEAFGARKIKPFKEMLLCSFPIDEPRLDFKNWKAVMTELCQIYGEACIRSRICCTPKEHRSKLTFEELNRMMDVYGMGAADREGIFAYAEKYGYNVTKDQQENEQT